MARPPRSWRPGADDVSGRSKVSRLAARLTGRWHMERLAEIDDKVGSFGRAQREALAAQRRQLEEVNAAVATCASAHALDEVRERLARVERLLGHQERIVSDALERTGVIDDQGAGDRRFARRVDELLRHQRPVIVGPWTGEVGYELIYWIPFVRWVVNTYRIPRERLLIVSRGGTASWYAGLGSRYADAFDFFSPDEFRVATEEAKKQRRVGAFDAELTRRVIDRFGLGRPDLLHPGMMYRLFMPFWKDFASIRRVQQYTELAGIQAGDDAPPGLPSSYVAVRFYFSKCFPDTKANRELMGSVVDGLSRQTTVVLLNTPFHMDDHEDFDPRGSRVLRLETHMSPSHNLALQTGVIARARAFVGTYGGYSYLAPFCGVPSLAFYSERTFQPHHLHVAQHAFERLRAPSLVPLEASAAPAVRLALGGSLVAAS